MDNDIKKILLALLMVVAAAIPVHHALALDLIDIHQETTIDCSMSNDPQKCVDQCHNINIANTITKLQQGYIKQLAANIAREVANQALQYAAKIALCAVIPDKAFSVGFIAGTTLTFHGPHCDFSSDFATSSILGTIKQQAVDNLKNNFLSRCAADGMRKQVENNIHALIQQNGPDGGQAFVSDWVGGLPVIEARRGVNRFFAILVNTPICSYFRDRIYTHYGVPQDYINHPPAIDKDGFAVSAGNPLTVRGACTLPDGLTPQSLDANWTAYGGINAVALLNQPQNNYEGFKSMADAELSAQQSATVTGATNEALAGGGFRGLYASCARSDAAGHCLQQTVTQPAGGVEAAQAAIYNGNFNLIVSSKDSNSIIGPVGARLSSMIMSLNNDPLSYNPRLDNTSQNYVDIANGTKQPDIIDGPPATPPDAATLACIDNNLQCMCVKNNPDYFALGQQLIPAEQAALALRTINGPLYSADGVHVDSGKEVGFLLAVCNSDIGRALNCFPKPGSTSDIILDAQAVTISFNIIAPNNVVRMPGQAIAVCPATAQ